MRPGWFQDYGVYAAIVLVLVVALVTTPGFVSLGGLRTQLIQVVPVLVVSLGMALVIGTEGIDLSVGSVMAVSAAVLPLYLGYGAVGGLLAVVVVGVVTGSVAGSLVAFVRVQPIVATLALLVGLRGLATVVGGGRQTQIINPTVLQLGRGEVLGVPYVVVVAAVLVVVVALVVQRTTFGRQLVAIGGNRTASRLAGLPVRRVLVTVYVVSGVLAAVAGLLATARLGASTPNTLGELLELSAITAVVIGGTPLSGGRVRVLGTVAGALLVQLITALLISNDLSYATAQMVQAGIIVAAVWIQLGRRRAS
ncbi:ABC transporter permease [Pseudokineococcus basanitobsidens]|uniref:ABC transporter permease n=1 Tax=Pseudokineococcus basanitobsidens TaxID=1926649 RepID=UPI003BB51D5D